ncbi:hypothetical protein A33M_3884 [Rhodovulum sp. PH10]|nr:hypothetical protein A33M_3884 [Rhodovulum sp. PH10]
MASAAIAVSVALAGCQTDGISGIPSKAMQPLSREMKATLAAKSMPIESPILVRIFKEEAELEVWKQTSSGRYALLKTYPICRWSGALGPKIKQGDRQAPEGFYAITPGQMNPNSSYYLAFNLGFPNAYDKANGRTGQFLMVHGDCSSAGCYAMTDEQISEIYSLGREAFLGGQKSFQVQAYPFRMTAVNMARHRDSPHMAFWRMIKEGNDHFEVTRQEPKVDVCERRYVFDATPVSGDFDPAGRCPAYQVPAEIASAVKAKEDRDEHLFAQAVSQGIRPVAARNDGDGGMHPSFYAKLDTSDTFVANGRTVAKLPPSEPGGKATLVYMPKYEPVASPAVSVASADHSANFFGSLYDSKGESNAAPQAAPADAGSGGSDGMGKVKGWLGFGQKQQGAPAAQAEPAAVATRAAPTPRPAPAPVRSSGPALASTSSRPANGAIRPAPARPQQVQTQAPAKPQVATAQPNSDAPAADAGSTAFTGSTLISGAQPVRSSSSFANRWGF